VVDLLETGTTTSYGTRNRSYDYCFKNGENLEKSDFTKSYEWFYKAYKWAEKKHKGKRCEAALKIGQLCREHAENLISNSKSEGKDVGEKIEKDINRGASVLVIQLKTRGLTSWSIQLASELGKIKDFFFDKFLKLFPLDLHLHKTRDFLKVLSDLENSKSEVARELLRGAIVQLLRLGESRVKNLLEASLASVSQGGSTLLLVSSLDQLQEIIEKLEKLENEAYNKELKAKLFRATFESFRATTEAIKIPAAVEEVLKGINQNMDISEKVDEALILIDNINRAKNLAGDNKKLLCRIKLVEGKIHQNLLDNERRARNCYKEVIDTAEAQGCSKEWYTEAEKLYKLLLEKLDKTEDGDISAGEILAQLTAEIKMLDSAAKLSFPELIDFIFKNFPPKHKQDAKKPEMKDPCKVKKAFYLVSICYHPDKVDVTKFGKKYKVLCEEIIKRINERYRNM